MVEIYWRDLETGSELTMLMASEKLAEQFWSDYYKLFGLYGMIVLGSSQIQTKGSDVTEAESNSTSK